MREECANARRMREECANGAALPSRLLVPPLSRNTHSRSTLSNHLLAPPAVEASGGFGARFARRPRAVKRKGLDHHVRDLDAGAVDSGQSIQGSHRLLEITIRVGVQGQGRGRGRNRVSDLVEEAVKASLVLVEQQALGLSVVRDGRLHQHEPLHHIIPDARVCARAGGWRRVRVCGG